ncbi:methylamine utilization protein MauG [Roseibacterium beibuensis]|uniref:cytochrome-c peroxidase n=1 Tax=[Roseibacterium] beibuensis TaxID=1193142 RepID=UPI00217DF568|nr:cytochrome c peroxidase [Roseibacterium beibuensis]MCS6625957.1 methylamine utilization protein MauG [Roseibacterium beibuensis]
MRIRFLPPAVSAGILAGLLAATAAIPTEPGVPSTLEELGQRLFFDTNLSANRTQACATCHDPARGFADPRGAASIGDDGHSIGDRNAPTATYAMFSPDFHRREDGMWVGGQFLDGRAATLEDQAGGPPLNPIEMALPDRETAVARLAENRDYVAAFETLFGEGVLDDPEAGYAAMTRAIAAFERTEEFASFDSRYDRYLRGEVEFTNEEELGRLLFFSEQFTNCNQCHQLSRSAIDPQETFTNYEFHNIGVPENTDLRARNGVETADLGLLAHPGVDDPAAAGRFRTPTLRNVAVTGPYMHNGVFEDLRTVVLFYNVYNTQNDARLINPETGEPFGPPEVAENISMEELTHGPALDDQRIDAIVAFLRTLTDRRYEYLLDET